MPAKYFIDEGKYLDMKKVISKGLLSHKYPLAYLNECSNQRKWKGQTSTTQCISGTRQEYLKIVCDYAIDPGKQAFRIIGTRSHKKLEDLTPINSFAELKIPDVDITGTMDLLEQQSSGEWWLTDYKTSGAYKVVKALGLIKKKRPSFNEFNEPVIYIKSGKWGKVGDQKMENYWEIDKSSIDMDDWIKQLNKYRMIAEQYFDIVIHNMKIFAIVRDGGTWKAKSYGVTENTYYIDVPFMDNEDVDKFFNQKSNALIKHIESFEKTNNWIDSIPEKCTDVECWNGNKCIGYCDVAEFCKKIGDNYYLEDK